MLQIKALDENFAPISVYIEDLGIQISQSNVNKIASAAGSALFTQGISFECFLTETGTPCSDKFTGKKASAFSLVFVPSQVGTAWLHSPFFSSTSFHIVVTEGESISDSTFASTLLSTKYSYSSL